ncbi:hypothetical protein DFH29DRAFT_1065965 [Suillus ampliporus]|nr:hypothetical protein DFH29DRAFT_1065965 [Suillus ampliporus]
MYSKLISVALVFAATLAPTDAAVFPRDNEEHHKARDGLPTGITTQVIPTSTGTTTQFTTTSTGKTTQVTTSSTGTTSHITTTSTGTTSQVTTTSTGTTSQVTATSTGTASQVTTTGTGTPTKITETGKPSDTNKPDGKPGKPTQSGANSVSCDSFQPWQVNLAYTGGSQVIFNNQLWTAKQWSYNNSPESAAAEWSLNGVCNQPISNKVDCTGIPAWNQSTAYSGGAKVTFNDHLWISTQWTSSNKPGDASGTWKDLGACN